MIGPADPPASILVALDPESAASPIPVLERAGFRVIAAADGAAALRILAAHGSDLLLCDVVLADMDGYEVCRAVKQAPATRDVPVLLLMAEDDEIARNRAREAGADDEIGRNARPDALLNIVRTQLALAALRRQLNGLEGLVMTLARAVEDREHRSAGLSEKVAHWATELGSAIGLPDEQLTLLYKSALLHDVGTLSVPIDVLSKQGRLDPGEYNQVKRHPLVAEEILAVLPRSDQLLPAIRHHHERVDGAGYPDGLRGDDIPLFARIIAIADAYVAITNDRPYRGRRSRAEAVTILRQGAGKQWDAALIEQFVRVVEKTDVESTSEVRTAG